jgi:hypothetical protein
MKIRNQFFLFLAIFFAFLLVAKAQTQDASNNEQPKVVKAVAPTYPPIAIAANYISTIEMEVDIDNEGKPFYTRSKLIPNRFSPKLLQVAAHNAAVRWRFDETTNKSQKRSVTLTFRFRLSDHATEQGVFFNPPYEVEVVSQSVKIKQ